MEEMGNRPAKAGGRSGREGLALAGQIKVEAVKEHERAHGLGSCSRSSEGGRPSGYGVIPTSGME